MKSVRATWRLLLFLLVVFFASQSAQAAMTLTGNLNFPNSAGSSGVLYLSLSQQGAQLSTGGCGGPNVMVPTFQVAITITNGAVQGSPTVIANDCISPQNTYYNALYKDTNGNTLFLSYWSITAAICGSSSTCNVGSIPPVAVPGVQDSFGSLYVSNLVVVGTCTFNGAVCGTGTGGSGISGAVNGNLIQANGTTTGTDSGIVGANTNSNASNFTTGDLVSAGGMHSTTDSNIAAITVAQKNATPLLVRYVISNGNDSNDGLSLGTAVADWYTAAAQLENTTAGHPGGYIYLSERNANDNANTGNGSILWAPFGLVQSGFFAGGALIASGDPNYVSTSGSVRASGTVTVTTSNTVPTGAYYQTGQRISAFGCQDTTYDGSSFTIASASGTTITYSQAGANTSTTGCVYVPIGFVAAIGPLWTEALGGATGASQGGLGPIVTMVPPSTTGPCALGSLTESGNLVTAVTAATCGTWWIGEVIRVLYVTTSGYNVPSVVQSVTGTGPFTITFNDNNTGLGSDATGFIAGETPGLWESGTDYTTFQGLSISGGMGVVVGIDSNMSNSGPAMTGITFIQDSFKTGFSNALDGPSVWFGDNILWSYFLNCAYAANGNAPENTDIRAGFLMNPIGGTTSGLLFLDESTSSGGGGMRFYQQAGTSGFTARGWAMEGTGQTQPPVEVFGNNQSTFIDLYGNFGVSDSGDNPPIIRTPAISNEGAGSVVWYADGQNAAYNNVQGPVTVINANGTSVPAGFKYTTGPIIGPAGQGQQGFETHRLINLDTNASRSNGPPSTVRFSNLATTNPAGWSSGEGTGLSLATGVTDRLGGTNAASLLCTVNGADGYCSYLAYSGSQTLAVGDFVVASAWVKAGDHSLGLSILGKPQILVSGISSTGTIQYGSRSNYSGGNPNQVAGVSGGDGGWQRAYLWFQVNTASSGTVQLRLAVNPGAPIVFFDPQLFVIPASQVAAPAAPTLSASVSGALTQTIYYVRTTYVNATGETNVQSSDTTLNVATNSVLKVTSPGASTGAVSYNVYVGNSSTCLAGPGAGGFGAITNLTESGHVVTATISSGTLVTRMQGFGLIISGSGTGGYNGTFQFASRVDATHFTYYNPTTGLGTDSGGARWNLTPRVGDLTGPGETCLVRQNASPITIGTDFTEPNSGLVAFSTWYDGANTGAGRTASLNDTTNIYGLDEIADWAINVSDFNSNCTVGQECDVTGVVAHGSVSYLTTTYTNATTGFTNVTGLSFPVQANTNYKFQCDLDYQTSATTANLKVQWTGPSSPTAVTYDVDAGITATSLDAVVATAFSTSLSTTGTPTTATNMPLAVTMTLLNGVNAGTVQLQAAATGTGTISIIPGSCSEQQ